MHTLVDILWIIQYAPMAWGKNCGKVDIPGKPIRENFNIEKSSLIFNKLIINIEKSSLIFNNKANHYSRRYVYQMDILNRYI